MPVTLNDVGIVLGSLIAGYVAATIIFRLVMFYVKKLTAKTTTTLDDHVISALERPLAFAIMLLILNFSLEYTSLANISGKGIAFEIAIIILLTYTLLRLLDGVIYWYNDEVAAKSKGKISDLVATLQRIGRVVIVVVGATMVLRSLGIEITPLIAALGIGGLAVALAFQDTLANFFAGVYVTVDRPIKVGDYIEIEGGIRGYVVSIGWRSTRIRTLANNLVIIPNSKLAQTIVTNYYAPTLDMAVVIQCSVAYSSDLEKVEKVTIEAAREIQKRVKGAVPDFDPFIRYHTFGDNGINFSIILRVNEFVDQYLITHEFIKELHKRYTKQGIEIPFPQITLHYASGELKSKKR